MARFNASSLVLLLLFCYGLSGAAEAAYNVANFGAKPDGRTDSSGAFASAWSAACRSQVPATVYVPNGHFLLSRAAFTGPCSSWMTLQVDGMLVAPSDCTSRDGWIVFDHVDGLTVSGGTVDGHGEAMWACKAAGHGGCGPSGATSLEVLNSRNVVISGQTLVDSELYHVVIHSCEGVTVQDVRIVKPGSRPNTDGIHVQTSIQTGDDSVSVGPGTTNLRMGHASSGPRHGISSPQPFIVTVDQTGRGQYKTIQEAINAIPAGEINSRINVNPGIYTEKVVVNKPGVSLIGRSATSTIIKWSGPWNKNHTSEFALHVQATNFVAANLTFQNPYGTEVPAVAAKVEGDRAAFYDCRFISFQDTLLDAIGRHYYSGCYIEGATDFIFGTGKAFFERCHLHSTSRVRGAFTAQGRSRKSENTGFSFYKCELTGTGVATAILGRPWGHYARVVFALSGMSNAVAPVGWDNWGNQANNKTAFFGQFQCYGDGSRTQGRVKWAHNNLSRKEAQPFLTNAWVDGKDWIRPPQ